MIKQGDTSFKPGPIVGELQKVGIPAAIESGKVVIKSDKLLVKEGETISAEVAQMLTKLETMNGDDPYEPRLGNTRERL